MITTLRPYSIACSHLRGGALRICGMKIFGVRNGKGCSTGYDPYREEKSLGWICRMPLILKRTHLLSFDIFTKRKRAISCWGIFQTYAG
jgi:hypothetical protein